MKPNCNCIEESQKQIIEFMTKQHTETPDSRFDVITGGRYTNAIFQMNGGQLVKRMSNSFEVTGTKKTKKGIIKDVRKVVSITPPYCCFCGKKIESQE